MWKKKSNSKCGDLTHTLGFTVRRIFKERQREFFVSNDNIKQNEAGRWIVNNYVFNREPNEELFLRQALDSGEAAVAEISPKHALKKDPVLVFCEARPLELNLECPILIQSVGLHLFWQQACG